MSILFNVFATWELRTKTKSSDVDVAHSKLNSFVATAGKLNLVENVAANKLAFAFDSRPHAEALLLRAGIDT